MAENNNFLILSIINHDTSSRYASVYTEYFIHKERNKIIQFFIDYCDNLCDEVTIEDYDIDIDSDESIKNFFKNNDSLEFYCICNKYIIEINKMIINLNNGIHIEEEGYNYG